MREINQELEYVKFLNKEDIKAQFRMMNLGLIAVIMLLNVLIFVYLYIFDQATLSSAYKAFHADQVDAYFHIGWYVFINILITGFTLLVCNRFEFSLLSSFRKELISSDSLRKLTVLSEEYPKFSQILKMKINEKGYVSERDYSDLKVNQLYEMHLSNKCKMTLMSGLLK